MADGELCGGLLSGECGNLVAGRLGNNERREKARIEIQHSAAALQPFISRLAQQSGAGPPQTRHRRAKGGQVIQLQRMFWARNRMDMGHRPAMAGDDHFFARFHLVQQLAQMGLRLNEIDRDHDPALR
jgi:hypothetical protein